MKKFSAATALFLLALSVNAFADQAAYITRAQAEKAVAFLRGQNKIKHFCAPCGDKKATIEHIYKLKAAPAGYENFWEVKINGKGVDLAYVYYQKGKKWKNLAKEMRIKVKEVPAKLPSENK